MYRGTLPNLQLRIRIPQFHLKLAHHRSNQTSKLDLRKPLPDTTPWAVEEGQQSVVITRPAGLIRASCVWVDPSFWVECSCLGTPEFFLSVDDVWRDHEEGIFGDGDAGDSGVAGGDADSSGDGGVEADDFVADGVEVGEGVEGCSGSGSW